MPARNPVTGDLIQTRAASQAYLDNYPFKTTKPQRGRFKWDAEQGKLIPAHEWEAKYRREKLGKAPLMYMAGNFDAFESPASGNVVRNKRDLQYDQDLTGCRTYEGREQEEKEAARFRQYEDQKIESAIDETLNQTHYDIQHGYLTPKEPDNG